VTWTGSKFVVSISDVSTEDSDKADSPEGYTSLLAQAEWIAEAPSLNNITQPLADFGTISFGGDYTGLPDTCYATIGGQTQPVGAFPANTVIPTTLVQSFSPRVVTESIPSKLSQDSSSFTVTTSTLTTMAVLDQTTGTQPIAGLIQGSDGNFYGVTSAGGAQNGGTLFEVTSSGTFTTLYNFSNGSAPLASLMQATGGNFYGTTSEGGLGDGTIFSFAPGGTPTNLWAFCEDENCAGGGYPNSGLTQAADGSLYGTTSSFAQGDEGTAYQLTPSGVLAKPTPYTFCQLPDCLTQDHSLAVTALNGRTDARCVERQNGLVTILCDPQWPGSTWNLSTLVATLPLGLPDSPAKPVPHTTPTPLPPAPAAQPEMSPDRSASLHIATPPVSA